MYTALNSLEEWAKIASQETITNYKVLIAKSDAINTEFNASYIHQKHVC